MRYAWELLVNVYGIEEERLYATYFGGDETLGGCNLPVGFECVVTCVMLHEITFRSPPKLLSSKPQDSKQISKLETFGFNTCPKNGCWRVTRRTTFGR